jgi:outer membrane murein-binding lipoprotein Lpp
MYRPVAAFALLLLAGCKQEAGFDERYKAAEQKLDAKAAAIDRDLTVTETEPAAAAEAAVKQ